IWYTIGRIQFIVPLERAPLRAWRGGGHRPNANCGFSSLQNSRHAGPSRIEPLSEEQPTTDQLQGHKLDLGGKRVLVVGLARSGRAAAHAFQQRGSVVTVNDLRPPVAFASEIPELLNAKIGLELGLHRLETFLRQDLIVVSPGV